MTHGSLFSGIGGFDLAAEWMGWENKFHCENNPFCKQVLKYYWPDAKSYGDIKEADFSIWRGLIDVLSGGFPCQPYSQAGRRKGKEDDRHLWPYMLAAIKSIQPRWVVGENVHGLINWSKGLVFHEVQTDLEAAGYEVWPYVLPACSVNAPHRRDRIWFIAHSNDNGCDGAKNGQGGRKGNDGKQAGSATVEQPSGRSSETAGKIIGNSKQSGLERGRRQRKGFEQGYKEHDASNTDSSIRCEGRLYKTECETPKRHVSPRNARSNSRHTWDNFPTQPPVRGRNDGLSGKLAGITIPKHRNESIKGYGNAVVPQVVYEIFKVIEMMSTPSPEAG